MLPITQVLLALAFFTLGADAIDGEESTLLISGLIFLALAAGNEVLRALVGADDGEDPEPAGPPLIDTMFEDDEDDAR